jgi:hypothetical protein
MALFQEALEAEKGHMQARKKPDAEIKTSIIVVILENLASVETTARHEDNLFVDQHSKVGYRIPQVREGDLWISVQDL